MSVNAPAAAGRAGSREWLGLAVLCLPTLVLSVDATVLYLALPHLAEDLKPTGNQTLWIIDIFGFLLAGLLIAMGTIGDRIGRRRLLMIGAVGFGAASLIAAYASSAEMLIVGRALLGISGATLMPSTLSLIRNMFTDNQQRSQAIAIWSGFFASGAALGPPIGGLVLEKFWWGSVFLLAVPVMVVLLIAAPFLLPEYRSPSAHRLDLISVLLSLAAIIAFIWGVKELAEDGLHWLPAAVLVAGVVLGVLFVRRQLRVPDPLLDMSLFRRREFSVTLATLLVGIGVLGGVYLFIAQYLQLVKDQSPLEAGLWLLPSAFVMMVTASVAPVVTKWIRPGYVVGLALLMTATGHLMLLAVDPGDSVWVLVAALAVLFGGIGPVFALGTDLVVGSAPPERSGSAAAMSETASELGLALGIALLGSIGVSVYRSNVDAAIPDGLPAEAADAASETLPGAIAVAEELPPETGGPLVEGAIGYFMDGFHVTAVVCGVLVLVLAVLTAVLLRDIKSHTPAAQLEAAAHEQAQQASGRHAQAEPAGADYPATQYAGTDYGTGYAPVDHPPAQSGPGRHARADS